MRRSILKVFILPLLFTFCAVTVLTPTARAAVVETQTILETQPAATQDRLQALLARADVYEQLVDLGVDPDYAGQRIAALSEQELNQLQQHIKDLPAGGADAFVVLGIIFVVLIALELFGVTNIFRTR